MKYSSLCGTGRHDHRTPQFSATLRQHWRGMVASPSLERCRTLVFVKGDTQIRQTQC